VEAVLATIAAVRCTCFAAPSVCSLGLSLAAREHTVAVVAGKAGAYTRPLFGST